MQKETNTWYASWFDTPYYHILYKDRDHEEAQLFIDNLNQYLNLPEDAKVLDLACGRGRHSVYLNKLGHQVVGADLSANSIAYAKQFENKTLKFEVHDMRKPFDEKFDTILNLFTSFGYFPDEEDNITTLKAIQSSLTEYGLAVMDFMNAEKVVKNLVPSEIKTVEGIDFHITRKYENGFIYKNIKFEDKGESFDFTERVRALTLEDFETMMEKADIYLLEIFGNYKLQKFHNQESDRLIMIFK